jgi:hypothetical protein
MIFNYLWIIPVLVLVNLFLCVWIILKMGKLERFQTYEAHTNLQLINQSLNRLSDITEKLERQNQNSSKPARIISEDFTDDSNFDKGQEALALIRRGENPKLISKKLGISRSEIELLAASEKLSDDCRTSKG